MRMRAPSRRILCESLFECKLQAIEYTVKSRVNVSSTSYLRAKIASPATLATASVGPVGAKSPYKRRTSDVQDTFLQWERQHGVPTAWLASARGRPCVLARRRCALRSFHKYTRPDLVPSQTPWKWTESYRHSAPGTLVPSQTPWKSTESYRHFSTQHRYRYTAPCGTAHRPHTRAPAQGLRAKLRTKSPVQAHTRPIQGFL